MLENANWTDRRFSFSFPVSVFANIVERVRGTPARAAALVVDMPDEHLSARVGARWSAKEHIGHLDDLHGLDEIRLAEFTAGAAELTPADVGNTRTESARHNDANVEEILERFTRHRSELAAQLETLGPDTIASTCLHVRLGQRLRLIDWVYFIAEHDDHHLVRARRSLVELGDRPR